MTDGIRGGVSLTSEQKEWLLDPRTISCFKENEWTLEERCEAFKNRFPEAPRLGCATLMRFYEHYNTPKRLLYKDTDLRAARKLIPVSSSEDIKEYIPADDPKHIRRLKNMRRQKRFIEFTDQQVLYLVNKETLRMQEAWSQNQRIFEFRKRFEDTFDGHLSHF